MILLYNLPTSLRGRGIERLIWTPNIKNLDPPPQKSWTPSPKKYIYFWYCCYYPHRLRDLVFSSSKDSTNSLSFIHVSIPQVLTTLTENILILCLYCQSKICLLVGEANQLSTPCYLLIDWFDVVGTVLQTASLWNNL